MTILTIIGLILTAISVWQRCARPEAVLRRIKRGLHRDAVEGMVEDAMESGAVNPLAEAVMARPDSEIYKFAKEIEADYVAAGFIGLEGEQNRSGLTHSLWSATQNLTIDRVRKMMSEAEGLGIKP